MTALELVRAGFDAPAPEARRLARAGMRVAGVGLTALAAAGRLRWQRAGGRAGGCREGAQVLCDVSRRVLGLHGVELDASGPLPPGPALLASNHVSWLDPFVVASLLPCVPVAKADVSCWPVVGSIARQMGVVFVGRGDARSGARGLRSAQAVLAADLPILNFPEGTTTDGRSVLPFRKGLFGIARREGIPVIPVALAYDPPELAWVGDDTFVPHWLRFASRRGARAFIRLGSPVRADAYASPLELAHAAQAEVARLLRSARCAGPAQRDPA